MIQKPAEATGDLIGNKIADKITKVSKPSPKINSETNDEEILSKGNVSPQLRHKIIDDLILKKIIDDLRLKEEIIDDLILI